MTVLSRRITRAALRFLTDSATISRPEVTISDAGSRKTTLVVVGEDVPCRVYPETQRVGEMRIGGAEGVPLRYKIALPPTVEVKPGDRITVNQVLWEVGEVDSHSTDKVFTGARITRIE
jgi:hypothetical protein